MKNCIAYSRVSTAAQRDEVSLDTQLEAIREYAAKNNLKIAKEIKEVYSGAELFERPLLSDARELIRSETFGALIVYDVDRLSRNLGHLAILMDECTRYNAKLLFVRTEFNDSIEGKILFSIQGIFAEAERLKIIERTTRGRRGKAKRGTLSFKRKLYGYDIGDGGKRVINEKEARVVKRMFAEILEGKSLREIAAAFNDEKIPTPTGKKIWWANSVKAIIDNPAYSGRTIVNRQKKIKKYKKGESYITTVSTGEDERIEIPREITPAIISESDFDAVQKKLLENKKAKRGMARHEFLLRGLVRCATCGRLCSPIAKRTARAYVCTSKQNPTTNCKTPQMKADEAEKLVWDAMLKFIKNPVLLKKYIKEAAKRSDTTHLEADKKAVLRSIAKLEKEIQTLIERGATVDDAVWKIINETITVKNEEIKRLAETLKEIDERIGRAEEIRVDENSINSLILQVRPALNDLTFKAKVGILNEFGVSAVWDGRKIILTIGVESYGCKSDIDGF